MPEITPDDLFTVTSLVYSRWSEEYDLLKKVKMETDTGVEPDYAQFHAIRLDNHTKAEATWRALRDRLTVLLPPLK